MKVSSLLINIDVDNLKKAEAFYTQAFGLSVGRRFGEGGVELTGANANIFLLVKKAGTTAFKETNSKNINPLAIRNYQRHWCPVHLDFIVDSIEDAVKQAVKAGAIQESDIRCDNWGKISLFADPFGNGFCLIEFVDRGYDEIANR